MIKGNLALTSEIEGHKDFKCPICQDSGWLEVSEGNETGIRLVKCVCRLPAWGQEEYYLHPLEYLDYHPVV
jgi:hypothetical protein